MNVPILSHPLPEQIIDQPDALDDLTEILGGPRRVVRSVVYIRGLLAPRRFWDHTWNSGDSGKLEFWGSGQPGTTALWLEEDVMR